MIALLLMHVMWAIVCVDNKGPNYVKKFSLLIFDFK